MDADGNNNVLVLIALVIVGVYQARRRPIRQHDSILTGDLYFKEIMNNQNARRFSEVARMDKATFTLLLDLLIDTLCPSAGFGKLYVHLRWPEANDPDICTPWKYKSKNS